MAIILLAFHNTQVFSCDFIGITYSYSGICNPVFIQNISNAVDSNKVNDTFVNNINTNNIFENSIKFKNIFVNSIQN